MVLSKAAVFSLILMFTAAFSYGMVAMFWPNDCGECRLKWGQVGGVATPKCIGPCDTTSTCTPQPIAGGGLECYCVRNNGTAYIPVCNCSSKAWLIGGVWIPACHQDHPCNPAGAGLACLPEPVVQMNDLCKCQ